MIDLKFLRENPDLVKENIKKKFQDHKLPLVDEVIEYDKKAREAQQEADDLRAKKNQVSKQIGALMAQGKKEEAEAVKAEVAQISKRLTELEPLEKVQVPSPSRSARFSASARTSTSAWQKREPYSQTRRFCRHLSVKSSTIIWCSQPVPLPIFMVMPISRNGLFR